MAGHFVREERKNGSEKGREKSKRKRCTNHAIFQLRHSTRCALAWERILDANVVLSYIELLLWQDSRSAVAGEKSLRSGMVLSSFGFSIDIVSGSSEKQGAKILTQAVIVEHEVSFSNFKEMNFEDRSIGVIMDDQGWIGFLKRTSSVTVDQVQKFYVALLDVVDIDAPIWDIIVRGVSFQLSAYLLMACMELCSAQEHYEGGGHTMRRDLRAFRADARFATVYEQHSGTAADTHETDGHYGVALREDA
ncbi:hypothetical protein CJ030_MR3G018327 [Morella rubra]|uniref:Uncharacterized protein n=1 Tax=Morella rubra TaxID=262757 RepID=A0A6A1W533_9ROSI|nr:hypothetical protein CJ030_MR3G018327 [Morella rubra]